MVAKSQPTMKELGELLRRSPSVIIELSATQTLVVISQLKIALQHPENRDASARMMRRLIEKLKQGLPAEVHSVIEGETKVIG